MLLSQFDSLKNKFETASDAEKAEVERIFDGTEVWTDEAEFRDWVDTKKGEGDEGEEAMQIALQELRTIVQID